MSVRSLGCGGLSDACQGGLTVVSRLTPSLLCRLTGEAGGVADLCPGGARSACVAGGLVEGGCGVGEPAGGVGEPDELRAWQLAGGVSPADG